MIKAHGMESKEGRHELYKGALEVFNPTCGMCWAINKYLTNKGVWWPPRRLYDLPEIWQQRPDVTYGPMLWFPISTEGAEKRKQILLNAIEATKP